MEKYCNRDEKEILCPIIFEVDETFLDTNARLTVTPFNIKCGLFNVETNLKEDSSTTYFYLPNAVAEAAHHESPTSALQKIQNLHNALRVCLTDLREIMDGGLSIDWELFYGGKWHSVRLKFAVAFVISDTEMHDKLCCHFGARNREISCICRHCNCATSDLVDPGKFLSYRKFRPNHVNPSACNRDPSYYRGISHYPVENALDELFWGSNSYKVHLGTPAEPLHMHQKGAMKRVIESFEYKWRGGTRINLDNVSAAGKQRNVELGLDQLNFTGQQMGSYLNRQSDRDKPRTKFRNSLFNNTKKCGHEQAGVLLCVLLALLSDRGRQIYLGERTMSSDFLENEITVIELILMVDVWLKKKEFPSHHVHNPHRLGSAIGYYIDFVRDVCQREGMGANLVKNHLMMHVPDYMLRWGPPRLMDSSNLERSHKTQAKRPAELTQKRPETFMFQLTKRYTEQRLIKRMRIEHNLDELFSNNLPTDNNNPGTDSDVTYSRGSIFEVGFASGHDLPGIKWKRNPGRAGHLQDVINFVADVVIGNLPPNAPKVIEGFTEWKLIQTDDCCIFRAHPSFRSASRQQRDVWYDWALFDLDKQGFGKEMRPGQLLMFVDVPQLRDEVIVQGIRLQPGKPQAVVRLFSTAPQVHFRQGQYDRSTRSVAPYSNLVKFGKVFDHLHLIPCKYIQSPTIVVPNIPAKRRHPRNRKEERRIVAEENIVKPLGEGFFVISSRKAWGECFASLIESFPAST